MDLGGAGATSSAPPRALPELRTTGSAPPRARSCRPCHQPCSHHHALAFRTLSTNGPITPPRARSPCRVTRCAQHQPCSPANRIRYDCCCSRARHRRCSRSIPLSPSALPFRVFFRTRQPAISNTVAAPMLGTTGARIHSRSIPLSPPVLPFHVFTRTRPANGFGYSCRSHSVVTPTRDRPYHVQFPSPNSFRWDRPKPAPHANCQLNETPSIRDAFRKSGQPFFRAFAAIGLKEGYPLSYLKAGYPISYPSVGDKKSPGRWPQAPACFKSGEDKAYLPEHIEPHGMRRCLSFSYKGVCCRPPTLP